MSFLYPRTINIHRPAVADGTGALPYQGETAVAESTTLLSLPASIQHRSGKGSGNTGLPADAPKKADWYIFIPAHAACLGSVTENDIVIDDLGKRYQIIAAYWNSLGYRIAAELLQM